VFLLLLFSRAFFEDMALKYPISQAELINIHGVGEGKKQKNMVLNLCLDY
jgi:ATP-dependent DNA helicase RecQ